MVFKQHMVSTFFLKTPDINISNGITWNNYNSYGEIPAGNYDISCNVILDGGGVATNYDCTVIQFYTHPSINIISDGMNAYTPSFSSNLAVSYGFRTCNSTFVYSCNVPQNFAIGIYSVNTTSSHITLNNLTIKIKQI